jgi:hypothetical protein
MTVQGAIAYLNLIKLPLHGEAGVREEAINIAIESMEKQIPKFVECKEWRGYRDTRYKCPSCGKNVRNDETYCHKCGQAVKFPKIKVVDNKAKLDWSEEDD